MRLHLQEEPEAVNEDADEMPDVQETVAVIPGSTLLWRISSRPPHSAEVHAVISHTLLCSCTVTRGHFNKEVQPTLSWLTLRWGTLFKTAELRYFSQP